MLASLHIENMAVFPCLDVDFPAGLSAVTGETGAGKSVMIDSLLFLLGGKPARELLRSGCDKGTVGAVFSDVGEECLSYLNESGFSSEEEIMLQRTINKDGKTQAKLNGRTIPLSILRELSRRLVSVHGQNDNQMLLQKSIQEKLLDASADLADLPDRYRILYRRRNAAVEELSTLRQTSAEKERRKDMLQYQIAEIDDVKPQPHEEEKLLADRLKLQNAEKISKHSEFAYRLLYGNDKVCAVLLLEKAAQSLSQLSDVIPKAAQAAERLMNLRYEAEDIADEVREYNPDIDGDPTARLNRVEERLDALARLRRKYGADIPAVLAFRAQAAEALRTLDNSEEAENALKTEIARTEDEMHTICADLHQARTAAAKMLSERVLCELRDLDMPSVRFAVCVRDTGAFNANGSDEIEFSIATNPGEPMLPLSHVASGGELSRVMLALQSALNIRSGVCTAVFDEVDAGISGKTARKIGIKLSGIGRQMQVLCVTHSAQIASIAAAHYKISKREADGRAVSSLTLLDGEGRVSEIARILGGISVTSAQRAAAAEMIEEGKKYQ